MGYRLALIEYAPDRLRVVARGVEVAGNHFRLDYFIGPGDTVGGYSFAELLTAARDQRVLLLDETDGSMWLTAC